jgi:hypothetical protein
MLEIKTIANATSINEVSSSRINKSASNQNKQLLLNQMEGEFSGVLDQNTLDNMKKTLMNISDDTIIEEIKNIFKTISLHPELKNEGLSGLQDILVDPSLHTESMQILQFFVNHPTFKSDVQQVIQLSTETTGVKDAGFSKLVNMTAKASSDLLSIMKPFDKLAAAKYPEVYSAINQIANTKTKEERKLAINYATSTIQDVINHKVGTTKSIDVDDPDSICKIFGYGTLPFAAIILLLMMIGKVLSAIQKMDGMQMKSDSDLASSIKNLQLFYAALKEVRYGNDSIYECIQKGIENKETNFNRFFDLFPGVKFNGRYNDGEVDSTLFNKLLIDQGNKINQQLRLLDPKSAQITVCTIRDKMNYVYIPGRDETDTDTNARKSTPERDAWFSNADKAFDAAAGSLSSVNSTDKANYEAAGQATTTANALLSSFITAYGNSLQGR